MAGAARELQRQDDPDETYAIAVAIAVRDIDTCDAAAVSIVTGRKVVTRASTSPDATRGDELQYETGEGPCLEAIAKGHSVDSPDLSNDDRWPTWGPRVATEVGFHAMLAFQLFNNRTEDTWGALNLYSSRRGGFDDVAREQGLALAAHVAVAVHSAEQIHGLDNALAARTVIGQAMGIVMERYDLDPAAAFRLLARLSSTTNTKLRDLSAEIVATRRLPPT